MADLVGDDTPDSFHPHPSLRPATVELLRLRHRMYLCPGDERWASSLSHLNAGDAARTLARLSASDEAARVEAELDRRERNRERENRDYLRQNNRKYFHPSVWRNPHTRRELQRMLRNHPQRVDILARLHMWVDDEPQMRAMQIALLLVEQAELAAQPLLSEDDRQRADSFWRAGASVLACICEQRDGRGFPTEAAREDMMIRTAARRLIYHFAMRGDRLVAGLVGDALGHKVSLRRVRFVAIGR